MSRAVAVWISLVALALIAPVYVQAVSTSTGGSVNVGATIPTGGGGGGGGGAEILSISNVQAEDRCTSVVITWDTSTSVSGNTDVTSYVNYRALPDGSTIRVDAPTGPAPHRVTLTAIEPLTSYEYQIFAATSTLSAVSSLSSFTTTCRLTSPVAVGRAANRNALIDIVYPDEPAIAGLAVYPGRTNCPAPGLTAIYQSTNSKSANSRETVTVQTNIELSRVYDYTVCIYNDVGVYAAPTFVSLSRRVPPVQTASITAANQSLTVQWSNPGSDSIADFTLGGVRVTRTASCAQQSGTVVYEGMGQQVTDAGLVNDTIYYYQVVARNTYGEYGPPTCISGTPSVTAAAVCMTGVVVTPGLRTIQMRWLNPTSQPGYAFMGVQWQRAQACSQQVSAGQTVYAGTGQMVTDSVDSADIQYYSGFVRYNTNAVAYCGCIAATAEIEGDIIDICPTCIASGPSLQPRLYVNNGQLDITPLGSSARLLVGRELLVVIEASTLEQPLERAMVQLGDAIYGLSFDPTTNSYRASITAPAQAGEYALAVSGVYTNQTVAARSWNLRVVNEGLIRDQATNRALARAEVAIVRDGVTMAGYGIINPAATNGAGTYGFMVPNGVYTIVVSAFGYETTRQEVMVNDFVLNDSVSMVPSLPLAGVINNIQSVAAAVSRVLDNPRIETGAVLAAPLSIAIGLVNGALAIPWWNLLYYLQSLYTEPLLWLTRRRRKGWGVIFNSITKQPIDLAVVRLYDSISKRLLQSRVTDSYGRYNFLVDEGSYYLEVTKPGFQFPSSLLAARHVSTDEQYGDLYGGGLIVIPPGTPGLIATSIAVDQDEQTMSDREIIRRYFWQHVRRWIGVVGPVFSVATFIIRPGWLTGVILAGHVVIFLLFKRLASSKAPKSWGVIYDELTSRPLARSVARVFSPEYNRMLEATVTDRYGRYGFLVGSNAYFVTADKEGYAQSRTDIVKVAESENVAGHDLRLKPVAETAAEVAPEASTASPEAPQGPVQSPVQSPPEQEHAQASPAAPESVPEYRPGPFKVPPDEGQFG